MFDLLPLVYSFIKTYVTTFFHPVYAKRLEKTFKFFFHAYQVGEALRYVTLLPFFTQFMQNDLRKPLSSSSTPTK